MASQTWYFFNSGPNHPYLNMALDEAILEGHIGFPVILRLYSWDPPGLSLGYFQRFDEMAENQDASAAGAVITRRITGGDAILHDADLTYSVLGKDGKPPFNVAVDDSYQQIHRALASGFELIGIASAPRMEPAVSRTDMEGRCFYRVSRYDLVAGENKLVGSAQRRTQGKVLHHGSIPLTRNSMTPEAADLSGLAGREISRGEAVGLVKSGFERALDVQFVDWEPGPEILHRARELARTKYGDTRWIQRR